MKLYMNAVTGLVAVAALSTTSFHKEGDIWGETPARAFDLIKKNLVAAADVPDEIETIEIEVADDGSVLDGGSADNDAKKGGRPAKKGGRPAKTAATGAPDAGAAHASGGDGDGGDGGDGGQGAGQP